MILQYKSSASRQIIQKRSRCVKAAADAAEEHDNAMDQKFLKGPRGSASAICFFHA